MIRASAGTSVIEPIAAPVPAIACSAWRMRIDLFLVRGTPLKALQNAKQDMCQNRPQRLDGSAGTNRHFSIWKLNFLLRIFRIDFIRSVRGQMRTRGPG